MWTAGFNENMNFIVMALGIIMFVVGYVIFTKGFNIDSFPTKVAGVSMIGIGYESFTIGLRM